LTSGTLLLATDRRALNAGSSDLAAQAEIEQSGAATLSDLPRVVIAQDEARRFAPVE
jgi:hypothetical protein